MVDRTHENCVRKQALIFLTSEDMEPALSDRIGVERELRRYVENDSIMSSELPSDIAHVVGRRPFQDERDLSYARANLKYLMEIIGDNSDLRNKAFVRFRAFRAGRDGD